jgi:hypothetical protein
MKTRPLVIALVLACAGLAAAAAEKQLQEKRSSVSDYPFWNARKRGDVPQFVPGLTAVLQLTPTQAEQIAAARSEVGNDEAVKAARSLRKDDPSVTPEQREKAHATVEAANTKLRERVSTILTPEQRALIAKINAAYEATVEEIGTIYEEKFASIKADQAARRRIQQEKNDDTEDHFLHKLDSLLTPAQKDAMARAAEEEHRRSAAAPKKPVKN